MPKRQLIVVWAEKLADTPTHGMNEVALGAHVSELKTAIRKLIERLEER